MFVSSRGLGVALVGGIGCSFGLNMKD